MTGTTVSMPKFNDLSNVELQVWNGLLKDYPLNRQAFLSPCYCRAVASHFAGVRVLVFRNQRQPVGFLPIQNGQGLLRLGGVHAPVGGAMTDYFGLIAKPGFQIQIAQILRQSGINAIAFSHLAEAQASFGLSGEQPRVGLRTHIGESGNAFWESLRITDKKLILDTERRERKLVAERGALSFELNSQNAQADLEELILLKQSQYDRTGKKRAPLFDERNINLLRTLRTSKDPACSGSLSTLRVNGELVAAHFGLQCYEALHFWFPVFSVNFRSYSPGRILLKNIIMTGAERGIRTIDRGEGDTPAKRDFSNAEHQYYRGVWSRPGLPGLLGRTAISLSWRMDALQSLLG